MLDEKNYLKPIINENNTARNFLYFGHIIRNIIEIEELHVAKMNALNNATYLMIDLYHCHSHEETIIRFHLNRDQYDTTKKGLR